MNLKKHGSFQYVGVWGCLKRKSSGEVDDMHEAIICYSPFKVPCGLVTPILVNDIRFVSEVQLGNS